MSDQSLLSKTLLVQTNVLTLPDFQYNTVTENRVTSQDVFLLKNSLLSLGYRTDDVLDNFLFGLSKIQMKQVGDNLLQTLSKAVGAHVKHIALFKDFPDHNLRDPQGLFEQRLADHTSGVQTQTVVKGFVRPGSRIQTLSFDSNFELFVKTQFEKLSTRNTNLSPQEMETLQQITSTLPKECAGWISNIEQKEILANVAGGILKACPDQVGVLTHAKTATDVLRIIQVLFGANGSLSDGLPQNTLHSLSRPLRRAILNTLHTLDADNLAEDMVKQAQQWKTASKTLHPFEKPHQFPKATVGFALVRGTTLKNDKVGKVVQNTLEKFQFVSQNNHKLVLQSFYSRLEKNFEDQNVEQVFRMLKSRPGDMIRRLDQFLRLAQNQNFSIDIEFLDALDEAAKKAAFPMLLTAFKHLQTRTQKANKRSFIPKGNAALIHTIEDEREVLDKAVVTSCCEVIQDNLLLRSKDSQSQKVVLVDQALKNIPAPFGERASSATLLPTPRGTRIPMNNKNRLRLFLHWTQKRSQRIDLDLSLAMFDKNFALQGLCDYTSLNAFDKAAVHSGDITNAPAPHGATEYIDIDKSLLANSGVRYLAMVVFSYNDVPFHDMDDAFAGFMDSPKNKVQFDKQAVEQRFDLDGDCRMIIPMIVDLKNSEAYWVDMKNTAKGSYHSVAAYAKRLEKMANDLIDAFKNKPSMWDVACLYAAANAQTIVVYGEKGEQVIEAKNLKPKQILEQLNLNSGKEIQQLELDQPAVHLGWSDNWVLPEGSQTIVLRSKNTNNNQSFNDFIAFA